MSEASQLKLALYQYDSCPYCMMVRRFLNQNNVDIEIRDTLKSRDHKQALMQGGGKTQVPCLLIEKEGQQQWLYESADIINYIKKNVL